jgi:fumarate reductase subunit D
MKRSNQPPLWALFGAGGMLSALAGAALVFVTGIAAPLGWGVPAGALEYGCMAAFARGIPGKALLFLVVSLFLWHAAHRIFHTLHDLGVHTGRAAWVACYGSALAGTVAAAVTLVRIGF